VWAGFVKSRYWRIAQWIEPHAVVGAIIFLGTLLYFGLVLVQKRLPNPTTLNVFFVTIGLLYQYRSQMKGRVELLYGLCGLFIMGLGIRFVASPRHADLLLVTGPVSRHMQVALQRTYQATPEPRLVVAVGDCGSGCGVFGENYASCGRVADIIPVDVAIPGCPPTPIALLKGILAAVDGRSPTRGGGEVRAGNAYGPFPERSV